MFRHTRINERNGNMKKNLLARGGCSLHWIYINMFDLDEDEYDTSNNEFEPYEGNAKDFFVTHNDTSKPFVNIYMNKDDATWLHIQDILCGLKRYLNTNEDNLLGAKSRKFQEKFGNISLEYLKNKQFDTNNIELIDYSTHENCIGNIFWNDLFVNCNEQAWKKMYQLCELRYDSTIIEKSKAYWNKNLEMLDSYLDIKL